MIVRSIKSTLLNMQFGLWAISCSQPFFSVPSMFGKLEVQVLYTT